MLDYTEDKGLVFCEGFEGAKNEAEKLYISDIEDLKAYAILFRRYYNGEEEQPYNSEPAVCIFKEEEVSFNSKRHAELHAALWSEGRCEVYIIRGENESRVDIFNARRPAEIKRKNGKRVAKLENLRLAWGALEEINESKFSAHKFGNGTFWEQPEFHNQLDTRDNPHIHLLDYLMAVRKKFLSKDEINLEASTIDKLLVVSILVKFLEEIKDPGDNFHTLQEIYKENRVDSFVHAVQNGSILNIFEALAAEFNGKIFDKFDQKEKESIRAANLGLLAQFLRADIDLETKQLFFWEQYSFRHLPPEVISSIYENFIQAEAQRKRGEKEKGVVYTPIHLVNFLVDKALPINKASELFSNEKFKILDPACGSGVFLVATYKRLLQWWAINNSSKKEIKYPNSEVAQRILQENIFGVDVKETATLVSIFSLTTALLDKLTPKEIWSNLKLRDLSKQNIQESDFFEWTKNQEEVFDLVIGNPPFNPEANVDKHEVLDSNILNELDLKHRNIPRDNFALHFFEGGMSLTNKICMIIPSHILLYNNAKNAQKYRSKIFTNYTIRDIYDFTHLRRDLFHKSVDTPVLAIIADNKPSQEQSINHTVVKRMITSDKKVRFEVDYYDKHSVPWNWAVDPDKQFIWKTNLLGGGRLFQLIYRLSLLRTLKEYIEGNDNWKEERGFEGGKKYNFSKKDRIFSIKQNGEPKVKHDVSFCTGKTKSEFLYTPPFIVIDQVLGKDYLLSCFVSQKNSFTNKKHLYYSRDFIGVSAPKKDEKKLREIYNIIRGTGFQLNYQLFLMGISSSSLVLTETDINKSEILNIPYPENSFNLKLNKWEKIIQDDVLNYYRHLGKSISEGSSGFILNSQVNKKQLKEYGNILCEALNEIYLRNNKSWQLGNTYLTSLFTICQIGYGKNGSFKSNNLEELDEIAENLIKTSLTNSGAVYKRIVRIYKHIEGFDCLFLIKPNTYRYWLKSIALRDADDTFQDLKTEGY
jgi:hypothetical protein